MYRVSLLRRCSATAAHTPNQTSASYKVKHKGGGAKRLHTAEEAAVEDAFAAAVSGGASSSSFVLPIEDTKRNTAALFGVSFVAAMGCMAGYEAYCGGDGAH